MGAILDKGRTVTYEDKSLEFRDGGRGGLRVANEFFTHFNTGATIPPGLTQTVTTPVAAATYGTGLGGTTVQTSDDVLATGAVELATTSGIWQANRQNADQPLVFETKVKLGTLATREFFFGFSDAVTDPNAIALSTTSTFTTSAPTDGVYLGFSATPTSGAAFLAGGNPWAAISIIADTNTIPGAGTAAVATDTYYTLRIEVDASGNAAYFVDGKFIVGKAAAITATVPLFGYCTGIPRTSAGGSEAVFTMDYLYIGGK